MSGAHTDGETRRDAVRVYLSTRHSADCQAVWREAVRRGWRTQRVQSWRVDESGEPGEWAVLYGEVVMVPMWAEALGVMLASPPDDLLCRLPGPLTKRELGTMDAAAARRAAPGSLFVKPLEAKLFRAGVVGPEHDLLRTGVVPGDTPVLWSEPVRWRVEYRCFVADGEVLAASPYRRDGDLARDDAGAFPELPGERDEALAFARRVLADEQDAGLSGLPGVVLDVGRIDGLGWGVVEANAAWSSGVYGCASEGVLTAIARSCGVPAEVACASVG